MKRNLLFLLGIVGAICLIAALWWLSTVAAEKALLEADMSRRRRHGVIDKVAAALILQGYLDYASSHRPDTGADDPG